MRRDKQREEDYLRGLLTRLTEEMKERYLAGAGTGAQLQPEEEAEFGGATLTQNFYFGPEDADNNEAPPVAASRSRSKQPPEHHRQPQLPKQPQHSEQQQERARKSPQKPTRKSSPSAAKSTREMGFRSKSDLEKMFPKTVAPSRVGPSKSSPTKPAAFTPSKKISASPTRRKTPEKRTTSVSPKRPAAGKTSTTTAAAAAAAMKASLSPNRKLKKVDVVHKSRHSVSALSDLRKFVEGK